MVTLLFVFYNINCGDIYFLLPSLTAFCILFSSFIVTDLVLSYFSSDFIYFFTYKLFLFGYIVDFAVFVFKADFGGYLPRLLFALPLLFAFVVFDLEGSVCVFGG